MNGFVMEKHLRIVWKCTTSRNGIDRVTVYDRGNVHKRANQWCTRSGVVMCFDLPLVF